MQELPENDLIPVVSPWGAVSLVDAEQRVHAVPPPGLLVADSCGSWRLDPAAIEASRAQSTLVVEGVFSGDLGGRSYFEIWKVIAGDAKPGGGSDGAESVDRSPSSDCVLALGEGVVFRQGQHMLLFLRPNELGGAGDYRVAGGGAAAVEINAEI